MVMKARVNKPQRNERLRTPLAIAVMAAASFVQSALAVDRTWIGTGHWSVESNWFRAGLPGSSDKAIINDGDVTLSFNTSVAGLELTGGAIRGAGNLNVIGPGIWKGGN